MGGLAAVGWVPGRGVGAGPWVRARAACYRLTRGKWMTGLTRWVGQTGHALQGCAAGARPGRGWAQAGVLSGAFSGKWQATW